MNKPKTDAEWAAYRCQTSCRIGAEALEGKGISQDGVGPLYQAFYAMLNAVEELSRQVEILSKYKDAP